jgi:hypothetical protein
MHFRGEKSFRCRSFEEERALTSGFVPLDNPAIKRLIVPVSRGSATLVPVMI